LCVCLCVCVCEGGVCVRLGPGKRKEGVG
jgi:hypothetical protein